MDLSIKMLGLSVITFLLITILLTVTNSFILYKQANEIKYATISIIEDYDGLTNESLDVINQLQNDYPQFTMEYLPIILNEKKKYKVSIHYTYHYAFLNLTKQMITTSTTQVVQH